MQHHVCETATSVHSCAQMCSVDRLEEYIYNTGTSVSLKIVDMGVLLHSVVLSP